MPQEQDRDLAQWLNAYRVDDLTASRHAALLDKIVRGAVLQPVRPARSYWVKQAMAVAAAGVLGFYVGSADTHMTWTTQDSSVVQTASAEPASSVSADYIDRVVFGVQSWKEVSL